MFQSPRHRSARIVALVAGLACTSAALAQMPTFDLTNITWLQNQGLNGTGAILGQIENGMAAAHTSYDTRMAWTEAGAPAQGANPGAVSGPNRVNHATHVAGIMLSSPDVYAGRNVRGVASGARLVNTNTDTATVAGGAFYSGLFWLSGAPLAADVINVSWGSTTPNVGYRRAVDWIGNQRGKLVVVANENSGTYAAAGTLNSPEDGYNILAVGATGYRPQGAALIEGNVDWRRLAWYSGTGPAANGTRKPDLVAPGTAIYSASGYDLNAGGLLNDYSARDFSFGSAAAGSEGEVNGCSFAAPHVSGVSALLVGHAIGKTWEADGKSPMTLRSVLINGASKNVYDRANVRWDANGNVLAAGGSTAAPMDPQTGSGLLDARRTHEMFKNGNISPDVRRGGSGGPEYIVGAPPRPSEGWSKNFVYGTGANGNGQTDLKPAKEVRKGSYITSTLAWELDMTGDSPGFAADAAGGLKDLDLRVFKDGAANYTARSASVGNSVEHITTKAPDRAKYIFNVQSFANTSTNFALAWHTHAAPEAIRDFNGDFMGDRGAINDNGWFDISTHGTSSVLRPSFTNQTADASFAMSILPNSMGLPAGMAQELVTPTSGFWLKFDLAFTGSLNSHTLGIQLGGVDILTPAGIANGLIVPEAANTNQYKTYTIDLANNQGIFAGLTGSFQDLSFLGVGFGGGRINIDNITYVPTPGTLALLSLGLLTAARRRR